MLPALLAILLMAMIRAMQSFEIELVLGPPFQFYVYSTKVYSLIAQEPPAFGPAAALATLGLAAILPLIFAQRWLATRRQYTTLTGRLQAQEVAARQLEMRRRLETVDKKGLEQAATWILQTLNSR